MLLDLLGVAMLVTELCPVSAILGRQTVSVLDPWVPAAILTLDSYRCNLTIRTGLKHSLVRFVEFPQNQEDR